MNCHYIDRLALKFYRYEEIAVNKLRREYPDFVSYYFLFVYNDEMKLIILKIGKLVTEHPSLVTIVLVWQ
jgi:hypothetical protein